MAIICKVNNLSVLFKMLTAPSFCISSLSRHNNLCMLVSITAVPFYLFYSNCRIFSNTVSLHWQTQPGFFWTTTMIWKPSQAGFPSMTMPKNVKAELRQKIKIKNWVWFSIVSLMFCCFILKVNLSSGFITTHDLHTVSTLYAFIIEIIISIADLFNFTLFSLLLISQELI